MSRLLRYFLVSVLLLVSVSAAVAQSLITHKVKKNETMYGIARSNGITVEQLVQANPGMERPDYKLKKGDVINIPVFSSTQAAAAPLADAHADVRGRAIRLGVMLPLHDTNGDGRRMIEYYRGILMACDSLKTMGLSVDVHAWNTPEGSDINTVLADPAAAQCDVIIGPLYSKQMEALSKFVERNKNLLVVPWSINSPEVYVNRHIFQIYQPSNELTESTARRVSDWFSDYHPIIVDCDDESSTKGAFTATLRRQLEVKGIAYNLTSVKSTDANFAGAFSQSKRNIVVLNSSRTDDLQLVFLKLKDVITANPSISISILGYPEWFDLYEKFSANFHRYNMYIPAPFYTNIASPVTQRLVTRYRNTFHHDMMPNHPRFALAGYDHATFFLRGIYQYGKAFDGAAGRLTYSPVQTPLKFERLGVGGLQNRAFMFVHYKSDNQIETINY